jgi:DNA-binding transcriptional MerR regulator
MTGMNTRIEDLREKKFVGVVELASAATAILAESAPVQERGTVSEYPDERTIRYYLSEGLLTPSDEKHGTASVFGYLQLLQLLVVKRLQAEHLPIRKIRELVEGRKAEDLERLLRGRDEGSNTRAEALNYLDSLLTGPRPLASASPMSPQQHPLPPPALRTRAMPAQMAGSIGSSSLDPQARTWERVQIEPGLELHIRDDYEIGDDSRAENRLVSSILELLRKIGSKNRKRGKQP